MFRVFVSVVVMVDVDVIFVISYQLLVAEDLVWICCSFVDV